MPAIFAWMFFAPGVVFIVASIVRLHIDGVTVIGAGFLVLWFWLIGGFTRDFWIAQSAQPVEAEKWETVDWALGSTAADRAKWRAVSEMFDQGARR
jgi:hypothetical protein